MAVVRAMTITYGAQAIPGAVAGAAVTLHNVHRISKGSDRFEIEFDILVEAGTPIILAAAAIALETTFTTRRLALTVDLDGTNGLTLDDSDFSASDVTPTIEKVGDIEPPDRFDTNTSRMYRIRVEGNLPSLGTGNRLALSYDVRFSPSRRTEVTVTGTFSATSGGASASANYLALIDARVATITAALVGVFEKTSERYTPDDVDGRTAFEQVHKRILFDQASGTLANPAIVDPNLVITRRDDSDEGTGEGTPLITLDVVYDTAVDFSVNTDLVAVWETISLPLIAAQLQVVAGGGVAITQLAPRFDFYRHTISAVLVAQALGEGPLISQTIETLDEVDYGKIVREVWPLAAEVPDDEESASPVPTPAHVFQGARVISRTVTTVTEEVTAQADDGPAAGPNRGHRVGAQSDDVIQGNVEGTEFVSVRMTRSTRSKRKDRGIPTEGSVIQILERTVVETFRIVVRIGAADGFDDVAGGGGAGVGGNPAEGGSGGR